MARVYPETVGRYVWIEFEDIHAIKHITNNRLETKEHYAVERIIDNFWHSNPERPATTEETNDD
jgi:hypothetical protein